MNWKSAYLETRILSASPIELVSIMFEHAILSVDEAKKRLASGDVAGRSAHISKAIAIISELQGSLDHEAGGEIAANLSRLYQYMRERLTTANIERSEGPLTEVGELLETVGDAWRTLNASSSISSSGAWPSPGFGHMPTGAEIMAPTAGWSA